MKGAKIALIWEPWHAAFPNAKWVLVRREKEDIIASCMRTGFMRKRSSHASWLEWVEHHERRLAQIKATCLAYEFWPDKAVKESDSEAKNMVAWLGLEWNEAKVSGWIDPTLWKGAGK